MGNEEQQYDRNFRVYLAKENDKNPQIFTLETCIKLLSLIAIPIVLGVGGWKIQDVLSMRSQGQEYVKIAASILASTSNVDPSLRVWAVDLLNENSPVKLSPEAKTQLKSGAALLPTQTVSTSDDTNMSVTPNFPQTITGMDYSNSKMIEPQLHDKIINRTSFAGAVLLRPRFYSSKLKDVSFENARMPSADLRWTELDKVNLSGANLTGADFFEAKGMDTLVWSESTVCPDGVLAGATMCAGHFVKYPWNKSK